MTRTRAVLAVLVALVLAATAVVGAVVPDASALPVGEGPVATVPADAGGVVCALGDAADGGGVDVIIATPSAPATAAPEVGAARTTVVVLGERPSRLVPAAIPPAAVVALGADVAAGGHVWVGWADAPAVVWREWRRPAAPGLPRGRTAAPCEAADRPTAHVLGLRTDGGNEARLRLANPYAFDATAAVTVITRDGSTTPMALRNLSVPAGETLDVRLNDHVPERADVAAIVEVLAGRVAVEGLQLAIAGLGGVDGLTIVPSSPTAAAEWTLPWVPGDAEAVVWVLNPSPREVEIELTIHAADGPGLPPELDTVTVGAGSVLGIPSSDLVPPGLAAVGLSMRSDTGPVVVGGALRIDPGDPAASGIAALPALAGPDTRWILAGLAGGERATRLQLVNIDTREVGVTLSLRTEGDGSGRTLTPVRIPAGAHRSIPLPVMPDRAWALEVVADGAVVAAREGTGEDDGQPVIAPGVPSSAWRGSTSAVTAVRRDGWTRTPLG